MRIDLEFQAAPDLECLDHDRLSYVHRLMTRVRFKLSHDSWSEPYRAIVDTGSPYSVIPADLCEKAEVHRLFSTILTGIVPGSKHSLSATFADVPCRLNDTQRISTPFILPSLLVDRTDVPLILGFAGFLERYRLFLDRPRSVSWVDIR